MVKHFCFPGPLGSLPARPTTRSLVTSQVTAKLRSATTPVVALEDGARTSPRGNTVACPRVLPGSALCRSLPRHVTSQEPIVLGRFSSGAVNAANPNLRACAHNPVLLRRNA